MSPLEPLGDAQASILAAVSTLEPITVAVSDALGLVLAEPVHAREAVPPFANTAMDGYAVRSADTTDAGPEAPARLRVVGELPAGHAPEVAVGAGEAIRIMTGAPIPDGADAVVMVERTARVDGADDLVDVQVAVEPGNHLRAAGGDLTVGQLVFDTGTILRAAHIGVLASVGAATVEVTRRPRVGVLSTGDELVPLVPGAAPAALAPGQIRDSNRPMLLDLVREAGLEAVDLGVTRDDEDRIVAVLEDAFDRCDAVLTSGGVSVGDYDFVKAALDRFGVLEWRQVAIKPAKPLAFGVVRGVPVFGLPGNPVSSLVSFEMFARPALLRMGGHIACHRPEVAATALEDLRRRPDGKLHLDRVLVRWVDDGYVVDRTGDQASNVLSATALANGLALLPDGDGVAAGEAVRVMLLTAPPES
ncbi:MAG TPA: gephyrin-like molybdotransferase Glp [Acidimicrobiia bacterium]|nr:gephyrin-like molybdotransferase Glp [Acidimicrobiia bacterium]